MNEMIGHMIGDETVVVGSALTDFLTIIAFAAFVVLLSVYVVPYMRRNRGKRTD